MRGIFCLIVLCNCLSLVWGANDLIVLKEGGTVAGTILADKVDQLVVDLGFTVLVIPRERIEKVTLAAQAKNTETPAPKVDESAPAQTSLFRLGRVPGQELPVRQWVSRLGAAVVQVRTPSGLGSGFIISPDGYLVTNFHVIEGETQISIEVYLPREGMLERRSYKQVRIVAMNKFADLALLRIEDPGAPKFVSVPLARSDEIDVGERVFAIGSPLGLERTVTEGIVSTKTREIQGTLYLQTTAQINPGNSGGPLFNLRGEVVGVTNMKVAFGEGIGFAIPIESVLYFLNHRDAFLYDNDNPNNAYRYLEPPSRLKHKTSPIE